MSTALIFRVIKASAADLMCSAPDKAVLICLVEAMNQELNGSLVWPGQETIGRQTALCERAVRGAIKKLCDEDLIKLQRRTGRHNVYSINIGLIHRLLETGMRCRSEKADRHEVPVRTARGAGQSGTRCLLTTKEEPRNNQVPTVGCSSTSKVLEDPKQRELSVLGLVAGVVESKRINSGEQPKIEKQDEPRVQVSAKGGDP